MAAIESANKSGPILAVERALQILELLSIHREMSLNEMHQISKINKASLLRLAYTLVQEGYAKKDEETGNYSLTLKSYEIGVRSVQNANKMSLINSVLADLNQSTGRIAQFSVEDNNTLLCLQSIDQNNNLFSAYTNLGGRSPLYCTSAGKALLSAYSNTEILSKWEKMDVEPLTKNTITDVQRLLEDISLTRQRGYALDNEENEYQISCIGSIVLGAAGKPVGAISLSGNVFKDGDEIQVMADYLLPAVSRLSGMMGYICNT